MTFFVDRTSSKNHEYGECFKLRKLLQTANHKNMTVLTSTSRQRVF